MDSYYAVSMFQSRRTRVVKFQDPVSPQPLAALNFLSYMTRQAVCRNVLLGPGKTALREVANHLKVVTVSFFSCHLLESNLSLMKLVNSEKNF